ncbi:hypothetical protein GCM10027614_44260 [Micromonospora vulcania]
MQHASTLSDTAARHKRSRGQAAVPDALIIFIGQGCAPWIDHLCVGFRVGALLEEADPVVPGLQDKK